MEEGVEEGSEGRGGGGMEEGVEREGKEGEGEGEKVEEGVERWIQAPHMVYII